jgi:hypothetical protein
MNASVQKVLDLEKQFQEAKQVAIQDLLKQRGVIEDQLKVLGHDTSKKPAPVKREQDPNKKCPVCSETGHDARQHKNDPKPPAAPPVKTHTPPATKPDPKK